MAALMKLLFLRECPNFQIYALLHSWNKPISGLLCNIFQANETVYGELPLWDESITTRLKGIGSCIRQNKFPGGGDDYNYHDSL